MRGTRVIILGVVLIACLAGNAQGSMEFEVDTSIIMDDSVIHVAGEVLAKFPPDADSLEIDSVLSSLGFGLGEIIDDLTWVVVTCDTSESLEDIMDSLLAVEMIAHVQPNFIYNLAGSIPADPLFDTSQWNLWHTPRNTPTETSQLGADIGWLPASWITKGSRDVRIMIADMGIALRSDGSLCHPDLSDATRILLGSAFALDPCMESLGLPRECSGESHSFHGTAIAGIIGAAENGIGMIGVCPECELWIVKIENAEEYGIPGKVRLKAMKEAVDSGCHIVNFANTLPHDYESLDDIAFRDWVRILNDAGIIVVVPGFRRENIIADNDSFPNLITVTATNDHDGLQFGHVAAGLDSEVVSIAAPGTMFISATACCDSDYYCGPTPVDWWSPGGGTSFAIPHVVGVLGLMREHYGFSLTPDSMKTLLLASADKVWQWKYWGVLDTNYIDSPRHPGYGYGRLNAFRALTINDGYAGHIRKDSTIWSGTVTIIGDVVVDSGITLIVHEGTVVKFKKGDMYQDECGSDTSLSELVVLGKLRVNGTSADTVKFVSAESTPANDDWGGIVVDSQGTADIQYAVILNTLSPLTYKQGFAGHISTDSTIWRDTTVTIIGDVVVDSGITLIIDSGTVVQFKKGDKYQDERGYDTSRSELVVLGKLKVIGTSSNPIKFVSAESTPGIDDWGGIIVDRQGTADIQYATIKHGNFGYKNIGDRNTPADIVSHCIVDSCRTVGLYIGDTMTVSHVTVSNISTTGARGIYVINWDLTDGFTARIEACSLSRCYVGIQIEATVDSTVTLHKCTIRQIAQEGILVYGNGHVAIDSCVIKDSVYTGVRLSAYPSSAQISSSQIRAINLGLWNQYLGSSCKVEKTEFTQQGNSAYLVKSYAGNTDLGGGSQSSIGKNRFPDPPPSSGYFLYNVSGKTKTYARNCCWGSTAPNDTSWCHHVRIAGSTVDTVNANNGQNCPSGSQSKVSVAQTGEDKPIPDRYAIEQNYPNPFNPTTTITYSLPVACPVTITVYNVLGQMVKSLVDGEHEAGVYTVVWDGRDSRDAPVASGIYFYQMVAGNYVSARKMIVIK